MFETREPNNFYCHGCLWIVAAVRWNSVVLSVKTCPGDNEQSSRIKPTCLKLKIKINDDDEQLYHWLSSTRTAWWIGMKNFWLLPHKQHPQPLFPLKDSLRAQNISANFSLSSLRIILWDSSYTPWPVHRKSVLSTIHMFPGSFTLYVLCCLCCWSVLTAF